MSLFRIDIWRRRTSIALLAVAATLSLTTTAPAQIGELAGFTEAMQREYLNRDLSIFETGLDLDEAQRDILRSLFDDYKTDFEGGLQQMQDRLKNMKDELQQATDQRRILSMIFVPFEEWAEDRAKLGEEFLRSVQTVLNEQQLEVWPAFERKLLREKTLSKGVLSGESVNLLILVEQQELSRPVRESLEETLTQYELDLDQALRRRNEIVRRSQARMVRALQEQDSDMSLELVDEQLEQRVRVREVNDRYIDLIAAQMPPEMGTIFRSAAMEAAYPRAYRPTAGARMYRAAAELDSIDPATLENIRALQEAFRVELETFSDAVVETIRKSEPKQKRYRVELYTARMKGEEPMNRRPDPVLSKLRDRQKLDERFISILQGLLSNEQFVELPGAERWLERHTRSRRAQERQRELKERQEGRKTTGSSRSKGSVKSTTKGSRK
ncbi:MAG: hypothetical protein ACYTGC_09945 [Planctomycetota bacterium]|jgi:hypothetical protein